MNLHTSSRRAGVAAFLFLLTVTPAAADWPTLAGNVQRTSAVADEVRGDLRPAWYRPIEPYINYKVQVIAAEGRLVISSAKGVYALDANTGELVWVYPTQVPLGHSPTYANGVLYVGSYDRTIHAIEAGTGRRLAGWNPHVALAGFETNPLVINGRVYAGNRDGYFYCVDATTGALVWRFKTAGAIRNSAAADADGVLYFASEDLHGYALKDVGTTYQLLWKSAKLLGDSFSTYWPVVYRDWVIFSGAMGYFYYPPYGHGSQLMWDDKNDINANLTLATGTEPGDWTAGTVTMDASPILRYYESKPYRRRVFVLSRRDGAEYTLDTDRDGQPEYAPFTFSGATQSGPKYPPIVGNDGVLYTAVNTVATSDLWTPRFSLVGWKIGTQYVSRVMPGDLAADEPTSFSIGGKVAYWNLCCDRDAGGFDLSIPWGQSGRAWQYFSYNARFTKMPNYEPMYYNDGTDGWGIYGGPDGVYGKHGAQNPWVPYNGKVYRIMGNTVVAFSSTGAATAPLPLARTVVVTDTTPAPSPSRLLASLEEEISKMLAAGHLKPGLFKSSIGDDTLNGNGEFAMDQGISYFSNPADTISALVRALPYLSATLQSQTRAYIQTEMTNFPIDTYAYIGHIEGTARQAATVAPDYASKFAIAKQTTVVNNQPWLFPMPSFYAAWKYAQVWPDEASRLYSRMKSRITVPCQLSDSELLSSVQALNAYVAGYRGYLELERLAGQPETAAVRNEYTRLLNLLLNNFSIDLPFTGPPTKVLGFRMARFFAFLVPEIGEEVRKIKLTEARRAVDRINFVTPYWFVAASDVTNREGTHQQLYDVAILNAFAMVLKSPYSEIVRYLDAPAFAVGDLLYIHNVISALEAAGREGGSTPRTPTGLRIVP